MQAKQGRTFGLQEDFSKTFSLEPKEVLDTNGKTTNQIAEFIKEKYQAGHAINLRGSGHSTNKRNVGEILISNFEDCPIPELDVSLNLMQVSSGANLEYLENYLQKQGKHMVCLQDWTRLTIGGTVCVGGAGWESAKYGTQANQVVSFELVLPNGEVVNCSQTENQKLYFVTLAGLGMTGFIRSLKLQIYDYLPAYCAYTTCFSTLADYFSNLPTVIEKFRKDDMDLLNGGVHLQMYKEARLSFGKRFSALEEAKSWNGAIEGEPFKYTFKTIKEGLPVKMPKEVLENLQDYQLWCDFSLPSLESAKGVVEDFIGSNNLSTPIKEWDLQSGGLKNLVYITFGYVCQIEPRIPLGMVPKGANMAHTVGFAYHTKSRLDLKNIQQSCDELKRIVIKYGGRSYNYGFHSFTEQDAQNMYGDDWDLAKNVIQSVDPKGTWNKVNTIIL